MAGVFCVSAIADASVIPDGIDSLMVGGLHVALALPPQKQGEEQLHCLRLSFREDTATEHLVVSFVPVAYSRPPINAQWGMKSVF